MSCVTCHMALAICFLLFFSWQNGGASRWRVCYQWGLPCLVIYYIKLSLLYMLQYPCVVCCLLCHPAPLWSKAFRGFNIIAILTEMVDTKKGGSFKLSEVTGDLFSAPSSYSLAHCISQDCKLGKVDTATSQPCNIVDLQPCNLSTLQPWPQGIAKQFRNRFGRVDEIRKQRVEVGGVAVLAQGDRFTYNLVTKEKWVKTRWGSPVDCRPFPMKHYQ